MLSMDKKRILFILPSFEVGGTTVSTRNLISVLDKERYDITVLSLTGKGLLRDKYNDVQQIQTDFLARALALDWWKKADGLIGQILTAAVRFFAYRSKKLKETFIKCSIHHIFKNHQFDTIVACEESFATLYTSYINCQNKVAWIRCDYGRYYEERGRKNENFYTRFNSIVCVAEKTCENFKKIYPELASKAVCINNPQNEQMILDGSKENDGDANYKRNLFSIVSVGRFSDVKRFEMIPSIARRLIDSGLTFRWYIVGDGASRNLIEENIAEYDVRDNVILLGFKSNPHYYIANSDLFVCLSSSEACPRVINEAKILGTPIITTDFPTAPEFIENGKDGVIVPISELPEAIEQLMKDDTLYSRYKDEIQKFRFDNTQILTKLEEIL